MNQHKPEVKPCVYKRPFQGTQKFFPSHYPFKGIQRGDSKLVFLFSCLSLPTARIKGTCHHAWHNKLIFFFNHNTQESFGGTSENRAHELGSAGVRGYQSCSVLPNILTWQKHLGWYSAEQMSDSMGFALFNSGKETEGRIKCLTIEEKDVGAETYLF